MKSSILPLVVTVLTALFTCRHTYARYTDLLDFNVTNGINPNGSLISDGSYLYGITSQGGAKSDGVIFKIKISASLPLNMPSFTGSLQHSSTLLNRQTTDEINTQSFTVERSPDAATFITLGSVAATDAPGTNNYSFTDTKPLDGANYYRLKMYYKDGAFTYRRLVLLNNGAIQFALSAYPNPAPASATISFTTPLQGGYGISVTNAEGKTIKRINGVAVKGANGVRLDTNGMAAGVYVVTYTDAQGQHSVKLVKK